MKGLRKFSTVCLNCDTVSKSVCQVSSSQSVTVLRDKMCHHWRMIIWSSYWVAVSSPLIANHGRDINETLGYETETFGFHSETRLRPRPFHNSSRPRRDRDIRFSVQDECPTLDQKVVNSISGSVKVMCMFVIFRPTISKLCLMLTLKLQGLIWLMMMAWSKRGTETLTQLL